MLVGVVNSQAQIESALAQLSPTSAAGAPSSSIQPGTGPSGYEPTLHVLYGDLLGRQEDALGTSFWTSQAAQVGDLGVFRGIAGSPEAVRRAQTDPFGYVSGQYQALLNRRPTSQEQNWWVNQLKSGPNGTITAATVREQARQFGNSAQNENPSLTGQVA